MTRKLLVYEKDGERVRCLWVNGECKTPEAFQKIVAGGYSWLYIRSSGDNTPKVHLKFVSKKLNPDLRPDLLGEQNPPKAQPKPVEHNEDGTEKPKRNRLNVTPEMVTKMTTLVGEGKTLMLASAELGIPYASLVALAKKEGIKFVKGQRGKKRKEAKPTDTALLDKIKTFTHLTVKEAAVALEMSYPTLYVLAKKEGIVFKAGKRGKPKKA